MEITFMLNYTDITFSCFAQHHKRYTYRQSQYLQALRKVKTVVKKLF